MYTRVSRAVCIAMEREGAEVPFARNLNAVQYNMYIPTLTSISTKRSYVVSWPAVPRSVINKFVIANVRWRVDADFELHRRHDERAGARAPGIHLVVDCSR